LKAKDIGTVGQKWHFQARRASLGISTEFTCPEHGYGFPAMLKTIMFRPFSSDSPAPNGRAGSVPGKAFLSDQEQKCFFVSERIHFGVDDRIRQISALDIATDTKVADQSVQISGLEAEAGGGPGHVAFGLGHGGKDQSLFRLMDHLVKAPEADL
jgi:hypothetical protein